MESHDAKAYYLYMAWEDVDSSYEIACKSKDSVKLSYDGIFHKVTHICHTR